MRERAFICSQCGAPVEGRECSHCGTRFFSGMHRLLLISAGNHPRLIEEILEEMALTFYEPSATENARELAGAISLVRSAGDGPLKTPVLLLTLDSLETLEVLKRKIEGCGGRAILE